MYVLFSQLTARNVFQGICLLSLHNLCIHIGVDVPRNSSHGYHYVIKKSIKVARYSVLGSIPPEFEHKLNKYLGKCPPQLY